jgi:hypothetical protein
MLRCERAAILEGATDANHIHIILKISTKKRASFVLDGSRLILRDGFVLRRTDARDVFTVVSIFAGIVSQNLLQQ